MASSRITIIAPHVRCVLDIMCEDLGLDRGALVQGLGVEAHDLDDVDARVPCALETRLWERAARLDGEPALGLRVAQHMQSRSWGLVGYLAKASATLGDAFALSARYSAFVAPAVTWDIQETDAGVRLSDNVAPWVPIMEALTLVNHDWTECEYASYVFAARACTGVSDWSPVRVELWHPEPAHASALREALGCEVRFGCATNAIVVGHDAWNTPLHTSEPTLKHYLEQQLGDALEQLPSAGPVSARVHDAVLERLPSGAVDAESIARALGLSARSLRRHLKAEGVSFRQVLDHIRCKLALRYLAMPDLGLCDVAFVLGYSDQSAFQRAFKGWTGQTPGQYRRASSQAAMGGGEA